MKTNKKFFKYFLTLLFFAVLLVSSALAVESPVLKASLSKYSPSPAEPGSYVDVWIKIENTGNGDAKNTQIVFTPNFPFTLDNPEDAVQTIGILGANKDYVVEYKVRVNENAIPGENNIKVKFTDDPVLNVWTERELTVQIQSLDATLSVQSVETIPSEIPPGEKAKIILKIKNSAGTILKDISVKLNLFTTTTVTATSVSTSDVPFIPIDSTTEKRIFSLSPGQSTDIEFNIQAYPSAETKLYKIPLEITYHDETGKNYSKTDLIGVVVNSEPELIVGIESSGLYQTQKSGNVVFKFVNEGLSKVKFLTVTLQESKQYDILSPSNDVYIGNIDPDDYDTAEYQVYLKDGSTIDFPLKITYRDSINKLYEKTETVSVKVRSAEELGIKKSNTWVYILIIVVVAAAGFFVYRSRRRKK